MHNMDMINMLVVKMHKVSNENMLERPWIDTCYLLGYQYGGYPYNYEGYGQYAADGKDGNAAEGESNETGHDNIGQGGDTKDENNTSTSQAAADYYAQYYGSNSGGETGGEAGADQQQWNQDAYYQWYQQYYGDGQQYQQDQQQQQDEGQHHQSGESAPAEQ